MRFLKVTSLIAFFVSIPFLGYSVSPDSPYINSLPYAAMFAALAAYTYTLAFDRGAHAGNRIRILGLRALFFTCVAVVIFGVYQYVVPSVRLPGSW